MPNSSIDNIEFFNTELLAIYPSNQHTMKGFFAFLRNIDKKYESRYTISAPTKTGNISDLVKYFEHPGGYIMTSDNVSDVIITFNSPFIVTHYSLVNGFRLDDIKNTYNKAWDLIGVDLNGFEYIIDSRRDVWFCNDIVCNVSKIITFKTSVVNGDWNGRFITKKLNAKC